MGELELIINDRPLRIGNYPQHWDEMSTKLYIKICSLLASKQDSALSKIKILQAVFNMERWFYKPSLRIKTLLTLPGIHMHTILHDKGILGYIFSATGPKTMLVPCFRHRLRTYYAPPTALTNVCTEELIAAWYAFAQFAKTQDNKYLDKLIALLYRPHRKISRRDAFDIRFAADRREPLNQLKWDQRIKQIATLDHGLKIAILKQFSGHWAVFENKYKAVFPKGKKTDTSGNGSSLLKLMYDVSGNKFGTLEQTAKTNADDVFFFVEMEIKRNKKAEAKMNAARKNQPIDL